MMATFLNVDKFLKWFFILCVNVIVLHVSVCIVVGINNFYEYSQNAALMVKVFHMLGVTDHPTHVNTHVKTPQNAESTLTDEESEKASMISEAMAMIAASSKSKLMTTIKNSCLPKLICELNASHKEKLSDSEKSLLAMIRETSISVTAEVTSRYHFAAHMGQLIAGVDGAGCHNFYPSCPFPGMQVLQMLNKVRSVAR